MERELKLNINSDNIRKGLRNVDSDLKKTQRQGTTTGKMISKATNDASRSFNKLHSAIGAVVSLTAAFSFAKTIAQFQALESSLGVVFGTVERGTAVFADIKRMAGETPFSIEALTKSVIKLRASGIEPTSAQMMLFADVAATTSDKVGTLQAITDLFARTTAGGLGLEDLERLMDRGIPVYKILADTMGLARDEITKFGQSAEGSRQILEALTGELNTKYGGAALKFAKELETGMSNAGIAWTDFQVAIGAAGGMVVATGLVAAFTDTLNFMSQNLDTVAIVMGGLSTMAIPALIGGIKALSVAIMANPIGFWITAITAGVAAAWYFRDEIYQALVKTLKVHVPNAIDSSMIAFKKMERGVGELMNSILGKINEFGNNLISNAPKWLQEFLGINGQTFSLGIDINQINSEIDALEAAITNRIANFVPPDSIGKTVADSMMGGGLSASGSLTGDSIGGGAEGGGIGLPSPGEDQLQSQIDALTQSLMSEEERIAESFERRTFMVEEAFQNGLIADTYRQELLLGLEQQFEDSKTAIAARGEADRRAVMSAGLGAAASILGSLSTLMGKEGEKQNKKQKVLAKAAIVVSTAQAVMNALAVPPYPLGVALAVAAALQGATQLRNVGAGGSVGATAATTPVSSAPSLSATPIATPTQVAGRGETVIVLDGNFYGWDGQVIDELIDGIAAAVDDRDVRIISPDSRNGQDLAAATG